ncbi:MAG: hypothetical protein WBN96_04620 [Gammaproteobacteria bacterium]
MKHLKLAATSGVALVAGLLLVALSGCEKGPAEQAGKNIDTAVEKAGDQMEKAGDSMKEMVDGDKK